jgi:hypothetical protein
MSEETPCMMGFWIRRMIDGSDESIWNATKKFMEIYDNEWLQLKLQEYSNESEKANTQE